MIRYVARRLLELIPVLLLIAAIVFAVLHVLPGDPVSLMLAGAEGGVASPETIAQLRQQMGLDDPLLLQFWHFVSHAVQGDFGTSIRYRESVGALIADRFPSTFWLSMTGLLFALLLGIPAGMLAAVRPGGAIDAVTGAIANLGISMPAFWLGLLLILFFSFRLHWLPAAGGGGLRGLILPGLTLGLTAAGTISRLVRGSLLDVLREDFIRTARAKGLTERLTLWRHALRNAMIPVVTMLGLQFGAMLAGAVVTETVFSRPGLGRLIVLAILAKDYPLVQGGILFIATVYVLVNVLVDILYVWLDPRLRAG